MVQLHLFSLNRGLNLSFINNKIIFIKVYLLIVRFIRDQTNPCPMVSKHDIIYTKNSSRSKSKNRKQKTGDTSYPEKDISNTIKLYILALSTASS